MINEDALRDSIENLEFMLMIEDAYRAGHNQGAQGGWGDDKRDWEESETRGKLYEFIEGRE